MVQPILRVKDTLASKAVSFALNRNLAGIGTVTSLKIKTQPKIITVSLLLKGEDHPIDVLINGYTLENADAQRFLVVESLTCSKEWITALAEKYPEKLRFEISQKYWKIISRLL